MDYRDIDFIDYIDGVTRAQTRIGSTRLTKNYKRQRLAAPSQFSTFRTVDIGGGKMSVLGKSKRTGKWQAQAILTPRD